MYAYLVEEARTARVDRRRRASPAIMRAARRRRTAGRGHEIREDITDPTAINYTWFETLLVDRPWNRGRVVLIGDAAHACPPTFAQGAAQCLEDAAVLAELLLAADRLDQALFDAFHARRFERAKTVIGRRPDSLARWLLDHVHGDMPGLMAARALSHRARLTPTPPAEIPAMDQRLITHLRHVDLAVPDFDQQLAFYTPTWGLTPETPTTGSRSWQPMAPRSSTWCAFAGPRTSGST